MHFLHRFVWGPSLCGHTIGGDHHPGPIFPQPAVHKYFLVWIFLEHLQESYEDIVVRVRTMPWNRNILHSESADLFPLAVSSVATSVHDNVDAHFRQRFEPFMGWLRSAKKSGRYFAEISYALDFPLLAERTYGLRCGAGALWLRLLAGTQRDRQQQGDGRTRMLRDGLAMEKRYSYFTVRKIRSLAG